MTVSASACSAVVLNQQQQTIQHHEQCDKAKQTNVNGNDGADCRVSIAPDYAVSKCTVVEHGRVVVRDILPTDTEDSIEAT